MREIMPDREGGEMTDKDNNVTNNTVENLEWCTQADNLAHADRQGRMKKQHWKGKRSPFAKLSDDAAFAIRAEYANGGVSMQSLAVRFKCIKRTVLRIVQGASYVQVA